MTNQSERNRQKSKPRASREWRGVRDTAYDFAWWLVMWWDMAALILRHPLLFTRILHNQSLCDAFFILPVAVDRLLDGKRGGSLRVGRAVCDAAVKRTLREIYILLRAEDSTADSAAVTARIVRMGGLFPIELMAGFTALIPVHINAPHVLPFDEYDGASSAPVFNAQNGQCAVICTAHHDANNGSQAQDVFSFTLPPAGQEWRAALAALTEQLVACIRFIERNTGESFDWDAFFAALERRKKLTRPISATYRAPHLTAAQYAEFAAWMDKLCGIYRRAGLTPQFARTFKRLCRLMPPDIIARFSPPVPDMSSTHASLEFIAQELLHTAAQNRHG